jgi:hypothetical protein
LIYTHHRNTMRTSFIFLQADRAAQPPSGNVARMKSLLSEALKLSSPNLQPSKESCENEIISKN